MAGFEQTVLFGAIIILIIALIIIGFALNKSTNPAWPPMVPACPDYWAIDGSGNNAMCVNVKNLGTCPPQSGQKFQTMNFNVAPFNGANSSCAKYTWATNCGLSWDGITYGVSNPCSTSS